MWIKRSLVIVPIVLMLFLIQSVFWVPGVGGAARNEGRKNRLILYMGGNPSNMNPWLSTATTDSNISDYLYEGLLRYNQNYEIEPWLAETATLYEDLRAFVPEGVTEQQFLDGIKAEFGAAVREAKIEPATTRLIDIGSGETLPPDTKPEGGQKYVKYAVPARAYVLFVAEPVKGKIASAVQPDFVARMEKRLGKPLYANLDVKKLLTPMGEAKEEDLNPDVLELLANASGVGPVEHNPIVDCQLRKGMHWTDGPFWETGKLKAGEFGEEDGPRWKKGPEFTTRDVKITVELIKDPDFASPRLSDWEDVKDVRMLDDYHCQVVYRRLFSPALSNLTGAILPYHRWSDDAWRKEAIAKGKGPAEKSKEGSFNPRQVLQSSLCDFNLRPSSLGSMVVEPLNGNSSPLWRNSSLVRMRRNENYWGRKPDYQFVDWYIFDPALGTETAEVVFNAGGMDLYTAKDYQVKRYEAMTDKYYVIKRQPTVYEYLGFNCETIKDKRVRLALSMAINVEEIIKFVVNGQGERINGPGYPVLPWVNKAFRIDHTWRSGKSKGKTEKLQFIPFDLEEAKALLIEAGYEERGGKLFKDGKPFKLRFMATSGQGTRQDTSVLAKEQWQRLGIEVEFMQHEWNVYIQQYVMRSNFDVCVLGWNGGLDFDSRQLWQTKYAPPAGLNFVKYSNAEADKLMDQILNVYDFDEQVRMAHRVFDLIAADFPYVFLYSPYTTTVLDRHIIWRRKNPVTGKIEDRPVTHDDIKNAKASFRFWESELVRTNEIMEFTSDQYKR
ncbi:Oligopeptide-binding protein AppA [Planctomycetaceae bacterium]|nr:Oligopeptide-binding protein AppA [Planctomycetaceae bacterium]